CSGSWSVYYPLDSW
nr:immunoglobulin heavy chain junction region [Macaca mulatta]